MPVHTHPENSPSHPAERRSHPRVALDCPVTIALADGTHEARLRDVSRAGVCLFLDRRIAEMTVLQLTLDLPDPGAGEERRTIHGGGVVVRCRPISDHVDHYEIAVFLNDMGDDDRRQLEEYLERVDG